MDNILATVFFRLGQNIQILYEHLKKEKSLSDIQTRCEKGELNICAVCWAQDKSSAGGSSMFLGWKKGQGDHCQEEEEEEEDEGQHGWTGGGLKLGAEWSSSLRRLSMSALRSSKYWEKLKCWYFFSAKN